MTGTSEQAGVAASRSMGHMALHYRNKEEGPLVARLLSMLGYVQTMDLTLENGAHFYRFVVDGKHSLRGDGIIYLALVPEEQRNLTAAIHEAFGVGTQNEHPAVTAMRQRMDEDPEYSFHYGTLLESLDELEAMFLKLEDANRSDLELKGRLKIVYNRSLPGSPDVDARLDASPIYKGVTRYAYGRNGVQAFLETDLLASGVLGDSMVLEFDYVFPGYDQHVFSAVEAS